MSSLKNKNYCQCVEDGQNIREWINSSKRAKEKLIISTSLRWLLHGSGGEVAIPIHYPNGAVYLLTHGGVCSGKFIEYI